MSSSAIHAGQAFLELLIEDSKFRKGLDGSLRKLDNFGKQVSRVGLEVGVAAAAITGPLLGALHHFASVGSELKDMSDRTGVAVEALSFLRFAAAHTGTELADMEIAIKRMQKTLEGGKQDDLLKRLGLTTAELIQLAPDVAFEKIATALGKIANPTERAAAALAIFGKSGTAILPLAAHLEELQNRFEMLGGTITTDMAASAKELEAAFVDLKFAGEAIAISIGAALAPKLTELATELVANTQNVADFVKNHAGAVITIGEFGAALTATAVALAAFGNALRLAAGAAAVFEASLTFLIANPIVAAIAAIVAGLTALAYEMGEFDDKIQDADSSLSHLIENKKEEIADLEEKIRGLGTAMNDMDTMWAQMLAQRLAFANKELAKLQSQITHLAAPPPLLIPALKNAKTSGDLFGEELARSLFAEDLQHKLSLAHGFPERGGQGLPDFKVPDIVSALSNGPVSTFSGRTAGQVLAGSNNPVVNLLDEIVEQEKKASSKLVSIDRKMSSGPGFKFGIA